MALTSASTDEYKAFRQKYGYAIAGGNDAQHLALAFAFLKSLPFCNADQGDTDETKEAQFFIAYAMSEEGGGFNFTAPVDPRTLKKKEIGRNAIVKEWETNDLLVGTDPMSMLRRIPMALASINGLLCPVATDAEGVSTVEGGAYVV